MLKEIVDEVERRGDLSNQTVSYFLEHTFYPVYERRWKESTAGVNKRRIEHHISRELGDKPIVAIKRRELQEFLDQRSELGHGTLKHLRHDLGAIFKFAMAEGLVKSNQASNLFVPRGRETTRSIMTEKDVALMLMALKTRELLVCQLATLSGMRPGEILALEWPMVHADHVEVVQAIYKARVTGPKTKRSVRKPAISPDTHATFERWRAECPGILGNRDWVFPSDRSDGPMCKDNLLKDVIRPALRKVGLGWVNFQVMRRTHASVMHKLKQDPKSVSDQLGHGIGVNLDVYTQTSVGYRAAAIAELEKSIRLGGAA